MTDRFEISQGSREYVDFGERICSQKWGDRKTRKQNVLKKNEPNQKGFKYSDLYWKALDNP